MTWHTANYLQPLATGCAQTSHKLVPNQPSITHQPNRQPVLILVFPPPHVFLKTLVASRLAIKVIFVVASCRLVIGILHRDQNLRSYHQDGYRLMTDSAHSWQQLYSDVPLEDQATSTISQTILTLSQPVLAMSK